jgi:hypothetical protein
MWVLEKGKAGSASGTTEATCPRPATRRRSGAQLLDRLLGQVVLFLISFNGVMFTIALVEVHWMQVVMCSLFDFGPGRPAQRVDEVEASCLTAELFGLDLLLRHPVDLGHRQQCGKVFVLGQRERLALTDRSVPFGVLT